jgi:hypothetical protein
MPKLKSIGKQIGEQSRQNDIKAQNIVSLYSMLTKSFDPITLMRLEEALEKWEKHSSVD